VIWDARLADDSGIERLASRTQSGPRFKRAPTWPAGRKRNADQTSSIATMDTARHPTLLIASRITSRLRSPLTFDVFFGYEIHTKAFGAACFESLWANLVICERRVAKTCTNGYIPPLLEDTVRPSGRGLSNFR